jgi:uncharacterized Zn finger protein (UPF0148 family)
MVQLEDYINNDPVYCDNCDSEFIVVQTEDYEQDIAFCPFCGSEVNGIEEYDEDDSDLYDED